MANQTYGIVDLAGDGSRVRQDIRTRRVECGALPNATTKNVAHGIPSLDVTKVVGLRGVSTDGTTVMPLPYTDSAAFVDMCEMNLTATNVVLISGANLSAFTTTTVFIDYYV